jgi:F-box/leucine-rich repeat protein 14
MIPIYSATRACANNNKGLLWLFQVSTRWRDAAYRKSVWKNVEAKLHLQRPNPTLFPSLVKRGIKHVQVLSLKKSLRELIHGLPNLESLNLSGCYNLSDFALESAFGREVPSLKVLNLSLCKDVTDSSIKRITANCRNIEILDLAGCSKVTNSSLFYISMLRKVRKLNLRSCRMISDHGIGDLCNTHDSHGRILEELCLQDCQKLTDESLRHVAAGLPHLDRINLSFCVSITDTGLKSLSKITSLRELNLRSCDNISDIGIGFLAENGLGLRSLDVSFCANITDTAMKNIAAGIASLHSLSLTTCSISDDGLQKLSKALADLEVLNIGQCIAITDDGLLALAEHSNKLRSLDLYGCPKVTSSALALVRKLPKLERLNLEL